LCRVLWRLVRISRKGLSQRGASRGVVALMAVLSLVVLVRESLEWIHSREAAGPRGGVAPPQLVDGAPHGPSIRWTVVPQCHYTNSSPRGLGLLGPNAKGKGP
jgi:hypothetical protein